MAAVSIKKSTVDLEESHTQDGKIKISRWKHAHSTHTHTSSLRVYTCNKKNTTHK